MPRWVSSSRIDVTRYAQQLRAKLDSAALGGSAGDVEPDAVAGDQKIDDASLGLLAADVGYGQHRLALDLGEQFSPLPVVVLPDKEDVAAGSRRLAARKLVNKDRPAAGSAAGGGALELVSDAVRARHADPDGAFGLRKRLRRPLHGGREILQ